MASKLDEPKARKLRFLTSRSGFEYEISSSISVSLRKRLFNDYLNLIDIKTEKILIQIGAFKKY